MFKRKGLFYNWMPLSFADFYCDYPSVSCSGQTSPAPTCCAVSSCGLHPAPPTPQQTRCHGSASSHPVADNLPCRNIHIRTTDTWSVVHCISIVHEQLNQCQHHIILNLKYVPPRHKYKYTGCPKTLDPLCFFLSFSRVLEHIQRNC